MSSYTESVQFGDTILSKLWKKVSGQTSKVSSSTSKPQTQVTEAIQPPVIAKPSQFPLLLAVVGAGAAYYFIQKKGLLKKLFPKKAGSV